MRSTTYGELLGVAIRHYRTGLRLNQGEAARRAELTQSTWSKLERGSVGVTVETLRNTLAPSLRVHPSDLLDLADRLEEAATARGMMVLEGPSPRASERASMAELLELLEEIAGEARPTRFFVHELGRGLERVAAELVREESPLKALTPRRDSERALFAGCLRYVAGELRRWGGGDHG